LKNGDLLEAAEQAGFDVFITGDKTVQFEQNMDKRKIAVVSLSSPHWPLVHRHLGRIAAAVDGAVAGAFIRVDCAHSRDRESARKALA
jgi:hypothetical protein